MPFFLSFFLSSWLPVFDAILAEASLEPGHTVVVYMCRRRFKATVGSPTLLLHPSVSHAVTTRTRRRDSKFTCTVSRTLSSTATTTTTSSSTSPHPVSVIVFPFDNDKDLDHAVRVAVTKQELARRQAVSAVTSALNGGSAAVSLPLVHPGGDTAADPKVPWLIHSVVLPVRPRTYDIKSSTLVQSTDSYIANLQADIVLQREAGRPDLSERHYARKLQQFTSQLRRRQATGVRPRLDAFRLPPSEFILWNTGVGNHIGTAGDFDAAALHVPDAGFVFDPTDPKRDTDPPTSELKPNAAVLRAQQDESTSPFNDLVELLSFHGQQVQVQTRWREASSIHDRDSLQAWVALLESEWWQNLRDSSMHRQRLKRWNTKAGRERLSEMDQACLGELDGMVTAAEAELHAAAQQAAVHDLGCVRQWLAANAALMEFAAAPAPGTSKSVRRSKRQALPLPLSKKWVFHKHVSTTRDTVRTLSPALTLGTLGTAWLVHKLTTELPSGVADEAATLLTPNWLWKHIGLPLTRCMRRDDPDDPDHPDDPPAPVPASMDGPEEGDPDVSKLLAAHASRIVGDLLVMEVEDMGSVQTVVQVLEATGMSACSRSRILSQTVCRSAFKHSFTQYLTALDNMSSADTGGRFRQLVRSLSGCPTVDAAAFLRLRPQHLLRLLDNACVIWKGTCHPVKHM